MFGKPVKVETRNATNQQILTYDGLKAIFNVNKISLNISITTPKYRFGNKNIGVGSKLQELMDAYKNQKQISDTDKDEFGFIDGYLNNNFSHNHTIPWVFYTFNDKQIKF